MSNFQSSKVHVFPSAYRKYTSSGKYTSEENFINIINSIVDRDCYVLSTPESLASNPLKIVLHGYYFEINDFSASSYPNLYAAIKVEQNGNVLVNYNNTSVDVDVNGEFCGLELGNSPFDFSQVPSEYKCYQLHITDNQGRLLNQIRFSSNSVYYKTNESSVSDILDSKQDKVQAGNGIKGTSGSPSYIVNNKVELIDQYTTSLDSMRGGGVGSASKPVYVNSNGQIVAVGASSGKSYSTTSNYIYTQAAVIDNGEFKTSGVTLYASPDSPPSGTGKDGDFWFKYEA